MHFTDDKVVVKESRGEMCSQLNFDAYNKKYVYFVYCNHILACRHSHLVYAQEKPDKLKLFQSLRHRNVFFELFLADIR